MAAQTASTVPVGGMTTLDLVVIAAYLLSMLAMGFWIARKQRSTDDFFVGGRNLPAWAVGLSIIASLLSTITYLGMPGEMFRSGLSFLSRDLGVPLVLAVVWFLWIPFFMRLRLTSAYEYLEQRFNYPTRALAAVFCILLLFGWMSVVVLTASKAMTEIADMNLSWFFGRNIPATRTSPEGFALINVEDVHDWPAFIHQLQSGEDAASDSRIQHVQQLLIEDAPGVFSSATRTTTGEENPAADSSAEAVATALSGLLLRKDLYRADDWQGKPLPAETKAYLKAGVESLSERELTHLNRSLLVATFPQIERVRPEFRDADMHALILAIGLFSVLYTTLGGIRAVIWTDVVQFIILVGGAFFTMGAVAVMTGSGIGDWYAVSQTYKHETVEWYSFDVGNRSTVLFIVTGMFFWFICTHGANQVALQRYFSVKDVRAARRSYLVSALSSVGLSVILAGVGMSLMYFIQHYPLPADLGIYSAVESVRNEAQDKMFPQFIRLYLPSGLRGLVISALFAAAMSTIDSGANSVSTIITVDFFRKLSRQGTTAAGELRLARMLTATMGVVVVTGSVFLYHISKGTDLISLCQKGFNCFLGPLGALFVLGMFSKRVTAASVIPAILVGEIVGVGTSYSRELFDVSFSTHLVVPTAWLSTIVSAHLFAIVFNTRATAEQQRWMWWPVVRENSQDLVPASEPACEPLVDLEAAPADA